MSGGTVDIEYRGHCAIVTLNRPDKRNAFNGDMWSGLDSVARRLHDRLPRVVVVTGAGDKAFCAGFDVNPANPQMATLIKSVQTQDRGPAVDVLHYIREVVDHLVTLPVPVIAAVNGLAYGGGAELASRCDLRVMDPAAVICFSEVRLGLMPDWGGGVALSRLVGRSRAADLILTARRVSAEEAYRLGLADRVSAPGRALEEALVLAGAIAKNGPRAVRASLEVIRKAGEIPVRDALELETMIAADLVATGECVHGVSAFLGKKDPEFPDPS